MHEVCPPGPPISAPFLNRDTQFSHALAGILTCARIHSIELDRKYLTSFARPDLIPGLVLRA